MVTQTSCLRSLQAEWRFTFPGWDEAGDPDKHLCCQLRLWRGVFQQHQWTCQGLHTPPACQGPKVWSGFWIHVSPNENTSAMEFPWNFLFFTCELSSCTEKEWQLTTALDTPGSRWALLLFPDHKTSRQMKTQTVVQQWFNADDTRPYFYWLLGWCTVDDSRTSLQICETVRTV